MKRRTFAALVASALLFWCAAPVPDAAAQTPPFQVLWWNANPDEPGFKVGWHRETMANYLDTYQGNLFDVTYGVHQRGGDLARAMAGGNFDVIVLDATELRSRFDTADLEALKAFYAAGHRQIMMDGTLNIRFVERNRWTEFPGVNGSSAGLLVNQVAALARRGGGVLIGSDHNRFQVSANAAFRALVSSGGFSGVTDPSTDGNFIGRTLLGEEVSVRANDLLQHWQSIPNQGEAPVGQFTDFMGQPITFYSLVEAADKPGGGRKRPYISASFDPGSERTAIDDDVVFSDPLPPLEIPEKPRLPDNMPTRKGPSN